MERPEWLPDWLVVPDWMADAWAYFSVIWSASMLEFLMGVAIAASCAFLTPIGHKNNTLIMRPGGFRFSDYWRMGLPLEGVVLSVAVPMLLIVWPL